MANKNDAVIDINFDTKNNRDYALDLLDIRLAYP